MYIDSVIISGIIVVIATTAVVVYASKYMISHIRQELKNAPSDEATGQTTGHH